MNPVQSNIGDKRMKFSALSPEFTDGHALHSSTASV